MKVEELFEARNGKSEKITRDAFLYLSPKGDTAEFAQCETCRLYLPGKQRCAILGPSVHVPAEASCGFYIPGEPNDDQDCEAVVKATEAGLVRRQVRCENCVSYSKGKCRLYETLNSARPDLFDLDKNVEAGSCCNAQTPSKS